uniref:Aspartyl/asparaginy/proline hydroxylase domain-containing protein n=1 Tax=Panagrolaimus sp. PS1159 TaxID=55785 RepID=A0AC35F1T8_9BILA
MLLWSLPERVCCKIYPVKPICTKVLCIRCPINIAVLNRAKSFVERALLFSSERVKEAVSSSLNNENSLLFRIPNLSSRSIWTSDNWGTNILADIEKLEENHTTIKLACLTVLKNASMWQRKDDGAGANWFIFPLLKNGFWCDEYCNLEPDLMEILHSLKSIMHKCAFGNIYFSLLPPKTKIQKHFESTNVRLKCELTLEIPREKESCFLTTVTNEKIFWEEGKCVVFDDSLLHSITNTSLKEDRIALILDFWHPSISDFEKTIIQRAFPQTE